MHTNKRSAGVSTKVHMPFSQVTFIDFHIKINCTGNHRVKLTDAFPVHLNTEPLHCFSLYSTTVPKCKHFSYAFMFILLLFLLRISNEQ